MIIPELNFCQIITKQILETSLYYQGGPLAALLYPATDERIWTFEKTSYYLHHLLLLLVPIYLCQVYSGKLSQQNNNNNNDDEDGHSSQKQHQILQNPFNLSWFLHAYGVWMIGNNIVHWISYFTTANINITLCPQVGVPSYGENYRLHNLYWSMIFLIISAILYFGMTRLASYVCTTFSRRNVNNSNFTNVNNRCQRTNTKIDKEE